MTKLTGSDAVALLNAGLGVVKALAPVMGVGGELAASAVGLASDIFALSQDAVAKAHAIDGADEATLGNLLNEIQRQNDTLAAQIAAS